MKAKPLPTWGQFPLLGIALPPAVLSWCLHVGLRWLQPREALHDLSAERGLRPLPDVKALKQLWSFHFIFCWLVYCLISAVQCKLHDGGDLFMLVFQEAVELSTYLFNVCAELFWCVRLSQSYGLYSLAGFSVCGILQTRIPEWVAMDSSRGSSWPRNWTCISYISCIGRCVLYH